MRKSILNICRTKQCRGIAMIEVLISVLLLSIGIIGLVTMQASMATNVTQAKFRSEASFLANQLIGQMWADATNLNKYVVTGGDCENGDHDPCVAWSNLVANTLPQGWANVAVNDDDITVTIFWELPNDPNNSHQYQVNTRIN